MDKKTMGIVGVIATTLLCAIPGLAGICLASMAIMGGVLPDSSMPSSEVAIVIGCSIAIIGLSLVFIAAPALLWFFVLRDKSAKIDDLGSDFTIPEEDF